MATHTVLPGLTLLECPFREGASVVSVLVLHRDGLALVDAGVAETLAGQIEPGLAALGRSVTDVQAILLTHADGDHAGSVPAIRRASGAALVAHPVSAERLSVTDARIVADGDELEAGGFRFRAVHTPGHRRDMLSLYAPAERLLISSDAAQGRGTAWGRFLLIGYSGRAYRASLERMQQLGVETLVLGHPYGWSGEAGFVRRGDEVGRYLAESLAASREIEAAVGAVAAERSGIAPAELMAEATRRLQPVFGFQLTGGAAPPAVGTTLESELRDLGLVA